MTPQLKEEEIQAHTHTYPGQKRESISSVAESEATNRF